MTPEKAQLSRFHGVQADPSWVGWLRKWGLPMPEEGIPHSVFFQFLVEEGI